MRGELVARSEEITAALMPVGERGAMRELAPLFAVMAIRNTSEAEASALMAVYASDLSDLPPFALAEACKAFRRGTIGDGKWAPTPGEIYQAALGIMAGPLKERNDIRAILTAQIEQPKISPERKAEVLAQIKRASEASKMAAIDPKPEAPADIRAVPEKASKESIKAALEAELERKAEEYRTRPVGLSEQALRALRPTMDEMRETI